MTPDEAPASAMKWASVSSRLDTPAAAADELARHLRLQLGEPPYDLVLMFVAGPGVSRTMATLEPLRAQCPATTWGAISARGVVTQEHEIEQGIAVSAIAARLPGVEVRPIVLTQDTWSDDITSAEAFDLRAPGVRGAELVLLLGDPFTLDMDRLLGAFNRWAPGVRVVGGMASAAPRPGGNTLVLNDWVAHEGGFALAFHGALRADVVVSQGCEPIGPPLDVTHVQDQMIMTLDGLAALERIEQVLREVPEGERERLRQGLYLGRPARGEASGRGDYLIRNLLGADRERGAIAVGDIVGPREKVRLHVRDAQAAVADLEMLLMPQAFDRPASGVLLFACNGRGRGLFGEPDHDLATVQSALPGTTPCAGMFCAGEVGPVGERNFMHGHTASIAIIRPR